MKIKIIPCLKDNYSYVAEIVGSKMTSNVLIDAPDFSAIDSFFEKEKVKIDFILSTHHHWDHIGANLQLKEKYNCKIFGSEEDQDRIPGIDYKLKPEETFTIGHATFETMSVPGHTSHHIVYYWKEARALFSGDTLFSMGCGRLFEGTHLEMFKSLQKIKSLPEDTKIYCGHEYSEKNAQFAMKVDPHNQAIQERYKEILSLREKNLPTVPTTLALEMQLNPFLRASTIDEFTKLRQLRDTF